MSERRKTSLGLEALDEFMHEHTAYGLSEYRAPVS